MPKLKPGAASVDVEPERCDLIDHLALGVGLGALVRAPHLVLQPLQRFTLLFRVRAGRRHLDHFALPDRQQRLSAISLVVKPDNPKALPLQFGRCSGLPSLLRRRGLRVCQGQGRFLDIPCRHLTNLLCAHEISLGGLIFAASQIERGLRPESEFRHED